MLCSKRVKILAWCSIDSPIDPHSEVTEVIVAHNDQIHNQVWWTGILVQMTNYSTRSRLTKLNGNGSSRREDILVPVAVSAFSEVELLE